MGTMPLVSVVTPVYNGEKYLAKCIQSVLDQSYRNFEYVILNNCSDDNTDSIIANFEKKDSRIKVFKNEKLFPIIQNWNEALRKISGESAYCKIIHSDDLILPNCLEEMVALAEKDPDIHLVSSYRLNGKRVVGASEFFPETILDGKMICSKSLTDDDFNLFGSPTTTMIKSSIIRDRHNFYDENEFHADVDICYDLLKNGKIGFVHKILTFTRLHPGSQTSRVEKVSSNLSLQLRILLKYGPYFLDEEIFKKRLVVMDSRFYGVVGNQLTAFGSKKVIDKKDYLKWHEVELAKVGFNINKIKLYKSLIKNYIKKLLPL